MRSAVRPRGPDARRRGPHRAGEGSPAVVMTRERTARGGACMRGARLVGLLCLMALLLAVPAPRAQVAGAAGQDRAAVLQELFVLNRRLEEARAALADVEARLRAVSSQEEAALADLARLQEELAARREQYGRRLRYYREQGNRGPWVLLLTAGSLADFLWRLDALKQIMDYDARLARVLMETQAAVAAQAERLAQARAEADRLRDEQLARVAELEAAIADREAILAGLGDERAEVEEALAAVEADWQQSAMPVLDALGQALQQLGTAGLQPDDLRFSLFPPSAVATITEEQLNAYIGGYDALAGLRVDLVGEEEAFVLSGTFADVPVEISGGFLVLPDGRLRFEPSLMQVREFRVPEGVIAEIVSQGLLDIDVSSLVAPLTLTGVELTDGRMTVRAGLR
ncbi:conserved hypothetical protein [Symbiobacterium thermophilum IAM 14863]|uniref:Peptidoglycan hydrolase PcsB coiled-coil domain-containing protein n=2 Tax=Symbiobacterium thermophilum TaxID=2734 RepID=Q67LX7_SYMTH|nr:conserved hypothetical protein [Symbiobacterium thermophilum IAM 14863]